MTEKVQSKYCIRKDCTNKIGHKGSSEYCSKKCFLKDYEKYKENSDTFRTERYELGNEQGGN